MQSELLTIKKIDDAKKIDCEIMLFVENQRSWIQLDYILAYLGMSQYKIAQIAKQLPIHHKKNVDMRVLTHTNILEYRWFVDQAGLYRIVSLCRTPKAGELLDWLELEVFPTLNQYVHDTMLAESNKDYLGYLDIEELRINEISINEQVQKKFTYAIDYDPKDKKSEHFFAQLQNTLLYAVTGKTAAEIINERCNHAEPRCGMIQDFAINFENLTISKNYLTNEELVILTNLCNIYLEILESFKVRKMTVTMSQMINLLFGIIEQGQYEILNERRAGLRMKANRFVKRELSKYNKEKKEKQMLE